MMSPDPTITITNLLTIIMQRIMMSYANVSMALALSQRTPRVHLVSIVLVNDGAQALG